MKYFTSLNLRSTWISISRTLSTASVGTVSGSLYNGGEKLITNIRAIYDSAKSYVLYHGEISKEFHVESGVRKDFVLDFFPLLMAFFMQKVGGWRLCHLSSNALTAMLAISH